MQSTQSGFLPRTWARLSRIDQVMDGLLQMGHLLVHQIVTMLLHSKLVEAFTSMGTVAVWSGAPQQR